MSPVTDSATSRGRRDELKVSSKFPFLPTLRYPVLDYEYQPRASQGTSLDSTFQISVQKDLGVQDQAKTPAANMKIGVAIHNIKPRVRDHVWSAEGCRTNGCKECCGCVAQQSQCDRCAEDNHFALAQKIHDASLHDWHLIERTEGGDIIIQGNTDVVAHDPTELPLLRQEPLTEDVEDKVFEIVDGYVETTMVNGSPEKVWQDTMLMYDAGY